MSRLLFLFAAIAFVSLASAADRITGQAFATRSEVYATQGMAATSQPLATQIALDVLKRGGSAVDAAIAANAALGLMEPTGNGIGGDLFALVWDARSKKLHGLNASGRSPQALTLQHFRDAGLQTIPIHGALPVSVPGAVDGWFELHQRFGRLPMKTVLQPTVDYARKGFPVSELIAWYWQRSVPVLSKWPGFREQMTLNGSVPKTGELWKNPNLANTLEQLGKHGRDYFYKGEAAKKIDAYMQKHGGYLRYADLAAHRSEWVEPLSVNYRGYDVWEMPPNTQGIAALQMLQVLKGFDFSDIEFGSAQHIHLLVEAKKLAFADRAALYADPAFTKIPWSYLISDEYADKQRARLNVDRAQRAVDAGFEPLNNGDTIYLTTADADGNMVSLIQSNYRGMGSGMTPDGLGFVLQNRGALFVLDEKHPNGYAPSKRPFHTIIPAFITQNGKPLVSFGVMGGGMQPQGHVQIVMNLIDFGMNLQEAGDAPRIYHEASGDEPNEVVMNDGGITYLESGFDYSVIRELMRKGHRVQFNDGGYGGYQAIRRDPVTGVYAGASEGRKDGQAAGY